jgi:hypothetical protein
MAIRLDSTSPDAQGLPVVSWEEDRNLFAPDGISPARVSCFIRPDENGVLQFVSVGLVRHGLVEEGRAWEKLTGFAVERADEQYYSASRRALFDLVANKSKSGVGRLLLTDGAYVLFANFGDEQSSMAMHLNCADCTRVEADMLHDRLRLEFLDRRWDLINKQCNRKYVWPKHKPFVPHTPPASQASSWWLRRLSDVFVVLILGLIGAVLYLLLGR